MKTFVVAATLLALSSSLSMGADRAAADKFLAYLSEDGASVELLGISAASTDNITEFFYRYSESNSWYSATCVPLIDGGWMCQSFEIGTMGRRAALVELE